MPAWDPDQYLNFADDRSRPFIDLMRRVPPIEARTVVDLGCGPGQLTPMIRSVFPQAKVLGIDSSQEMIDRARQDDLATEYRVADVATWRPEAPVDVMVSNALFQWVLERNRIMTELAESVAPGGIFALQVPSNGDAPSHRLLFDIARREPYSNHIDRVVDRRFTDGPEIYLSLFADLGWSVDAWSTTYMHVLPGDDPIFEWISGTGARPILEALTDGVREQFVDEYKSALRDAYPVQAWGTVFPFRRTFCIARRPA